MWNVGDVGSSRCGMFRVWHFWIVGCLGGRMFGMWDVGCGNLAGVWNVELQNVLHWRKKSFVTFDDNISIENYSNAAWF